MNIRWLSSWIICAALLFGGELPANDLIPTDPLFVPARPSHLAQTSQLVDITRAGDRIVTVGWRGHILYSDDQGNSWAQAQVPVSVDLTAVSFPSPSKGWAVGHGGVILHSEDGGATWIKQQDGFLTHKLLEDFYRKRLEHASEEQKPEFENLLAQVQLNYGTGPEQPWLDVWFDDEMHGYVVGTFNLILETRDGGLSWIPLMEQIDNPEALHLDAIARIGGELYIASERGTIFRLDPQENRFATLQTGYLGTLFGIVGNRDVVVVYGLRGNAFRSTDQGRSWAQINTGTKSTLIGATNFKNERIALVSQAGQLLLGDALATQFNVIQRSGGSSLTAIDQISERSIALVGIAGVQIEATPQLGK
ncbi:MULTISPECIES: WD40/YVTN/BNR-like repeat-containing protein [Pseudomonas]|uniref:WD40/YVTN/BNR-like repeat-containing protein n=1 Tax=Pseudomonas nitroreducens TaxID=46680 RepID=UPI001E5C5EB4|nr:MULTISPECIES: YCF48-related protein [Pseudomonas]MCE4071509.1 YCF48-related protein [Pseudomonas nitritireducens]MCE4081285.1 YCF48-related protein [Pseudomonas nitroreducens]